MIITLLHTSHSVTTHVDEGCKEGMSDVAMVRADQQSPTAAEINLFLSCGESVTMIAATGASLSGTQAAGSRWSTNNE